MGFRINTNIAALSAHTSATMNNRSLDNSLSKLSSGLRINKAADDASGLAIANSLRAQASSLGQAVSNGNDAIGLIQTADGALSEYSSILDTIKTKAVQAASDGQNTASRLAIQKDIDKLMEELNIIAKTTSFNGQKLLSGTFQNKEFQMGANANESVKVSIASAETSQIGQTSRADLALASEQGGEVSLTMKSATTGKSLTLKTIDVQYDNNYQNSMGALADEINRYSGDTGISAKAIVSSTAKTAVAAGVTGADFSINGINIGAINVSANDNDGTLVNAINGKSSQTGVTASMSTDGKLTLQSDGRAIKVEGDISSVAGSTAAQFSTIGKIELVQAGSAQFQISGIGAGATGADITISSDVTTTKDAVLAAGSTVAEGSEFKAGSVIGGDAKLAASMASTQLDTELKSGSTINYGSVLARGTEVGGSFVVGGDKASSTALDEDMLLTQGSTIKGGSTLGKGTVITTAFTDNSVNYTVGQVLTADLTLQAGNDVTLQADMVLKDNADASSSLKTGSTVNGGSVLGANFTVGIQYDDDSGTAATLTTANSANNTYIVADAAITVEDTAASTIAAGSLIKSGSTLVLETSGGTYTGPAIVTTQGTLKSGDTSLPGGTAAFGSADVTVTLAEDLYVYEALTTGNGTTAGTNSFATGSVIAQGSTIGAVAAGSGTINVVDNKDAMILADDMTLKAGSTLNGGSTLLAGSKVGDSAFIYGTGTGDAMQTYQTSDVKAGSVLQSGSVMAEGSTIGGTVIVSGNTTLDSDMGVKTGSILNTNTMLKAGTALNQDMTLKSGVGEQQLVTFGAILDTETIDIAGIELTSTGGHTAANIVSVLTGGTVAGLAITSGTLPPSGWTVSAGTVAGTAVFTATTGGDKAMLTDAGTTSNATTFSETLKGAGSTATLSTTDLKAGDVLSTDMFVNANTTLSKDMVLKEDSIIASGSTLAVNTENAGTVGLSNEEFTNLSQIDVTTLEGAMKAIDTLSAAITNLDTIRSDLGSVQNQVVSTINNISVTQVNVKAAESNIRDVDFAAESANFSKFNILAQSGSYAMSQANAVQQNVLRLLQ